MTASLSRSVDGYRVTAGHRVAGRVRVPASKSVAQRYLALALIGGRPTELRPALEGDDLEGFLDALEALGWRLQSTPHRVELEPGPRPARAPIDCGAGGTMLRFLTALLTTVPGRWTLDGTRRLRQRPLGPLVGALRRLGAEIVHPGEEGRAPVEIVGGTLDGGATDLDAGDSSQFLSALLMAAAGARRPVEVRVRALTSSPYVELTLEALDRFGVAWRRQVGARYRVQPGCRPEPRLAVEGDWSAACYPAAAAALTGGRVEIDGLRADSAQGDRGFLDLLVAMGAAVAWCDDLLEVTGDGLAAVDADLSAMPDQVPTLAAIAPFARGVTRICNVAHLRLKESDRLAAMAAELRRLGAEVEERPAGLVIPGIWAAAAPPTTTVVVASHDDHRVAMSLALAGLRRAGTVIADPGVVAKSYPRFWRDLEGLSRS